MATAADGVDLMTQTLVLLGGAVVAAPLFNRLGLGTVLGYLAAGIAIGPVLGLVSDPEGILHFAEFGIVFLLFLVGLELKPARLWDLRVDIFGFGLAQVFVTGIALTLVGLAMQYPLGSSVISGFGLALSSTAFALQLMADRGETNKPHGQKAFSVLLFQDLAIVPLLALIPIFAVRAEADGGLTGLWAFAVPISAVAALVLAGRYLLDPLLRVIAKTGAREAMLATALFVVLGAAWIMQVAGLSMALGAFIAGVLLAESSFRHTLEADIEPFRGLLLGLFFLACGLSLDLAVVFENWWFIPLIVPLIIAIKAVILYGLGRAFGMPKDDAIRVAGILPQGGEFGFVLFTAAAAAGVLTQADASLLIAIVTVSMALTPATVALANRLVPKPVQEEMEEDFSDADGAVIVIGFSRFAQLISQALLTAGTSVTIIDNDAERIRQAARFGFRIYFGDGTRTHVLEAAGLKDAKAVVIATAGVELTDHIVDILQEESPDTMLFVRSYDRRHSISLRQKNVTSEMRETLGSALKLSERLLVKLDVAPTQAADIVAEVERRDEVRLQRQVEGDIWSGIEEIKTQITPEPLLKPERQAKAVGEESKSVLARDIGDPHHADR
ncbi:MAG: monovalent cation:proton antiporter-2 (CPA2) family protein [Pseudomonadota bacterium]